MANLPVGTTIYEWINSTETPSSVYTTSNSLGVNAGDSIYDIYGQELGTVNMIELSSPYWTMYTLIDSYSGYYERNMNDTTSTTVQENVVYFSKLSDGVNTYAVKDQGARTALDGKQDVLTLITGYDATKTQTLKNINGTLTWVTD